MEKRSLWPIVGLGLVLSLPLRAEPGAVTLPVNQLEGMLLEAEQADESPKPDVWVCPIQRRIEGSLRKGLFSATLSARFEVLDDRGHIRVPVLDSRASLGEVLLNGRQTSLLKEGELYTVGVDKPGVHEVRLQFYFGQEQDRFARNLRFKLPRAGTTTVSVLVPEQDIEPRLQQGALEPPRNSGSSTQLVAHLDANGLFDLSWSRKLTHREQEKVRMESQLNTLFTLGDALVTGMAVFEFDILEGETDRIDLQLPPHIEVLGVDGKAVLQWHTEAKAGGRLSILLRYLVETKTQVVVNFQFPIESLEKPLHLPMPLPLSGITMAGNMGVLAPTGLNVKVASADKAQPLTLRDMPAELTDLTSSPLLFGFTFTESPQVALTMKRYQEVELTSTIIDELQASTVVIEDGTEITKLKLRIRNNTRQYLTMQLPPRSLLTHSLIDGNPVRPAVGEDGSETLMFPLRQSERITSGRERTHSVRSGETLSDISNFYYADPAAWNEILEANPYELDGPSDLYPGQRLRIPSKKGTTFDESSFVIELAYKRDNKALEGFGSRQLVLPKSDVDTVKVVWHLYLPQNLLPLDFAANLTQYSSIRYDPFRRVQQFLRQVGWIKHAWAGGSYRNILTQRKSIWVETQKKQSSRVVLASFPLVGDRYRFKRLLPGTERPTIAVRYVSRSVVTPLRWFVFLSALVLTLLLLNNWRSGSRIALAVGGLFLLLFLAHFVLGLHRRILWGIDLALLIAWARLRLVPLVVQLLQSLHTPWRWWSALRFRNFLYLFAVWFVLTMFVAYPLLLSFMLAVVLLWAWRRALRGQEVGHV